MLRNNKRKTFLKSLNYKLQNFFSNPTILIGIIIALVLFIMMFIIFKTERDTNSKFSSFFDVFWYTLVTITTVGYGDIAPESVGGRLAAIILLIGGVGIFGAFSGKFASLLFDQQLKKNKGLITLKKIKKHFIICGWKPNFDEILEGVIEANPDIPPELIVLINSASAQEMEMIQVDPRFKDIKFLSGDFADEDTLLRANIKTAERALVLSDNSNNFSQLEIDSRTVLAVLTMKNLNPAVYIAAELIDSKFEKHLSLAHCDEIILSSDYERSLVVQASSGRGLSHILRELISESSTSGITIDRIPETYIGKTFGEYKRSLQGNDILIGILENTGNFYKRRKEALAEAQKNPDMAKIVSNLKKVKSLTSNLPRLAPDKDYVILQNSKAIFVKSSISNLEQISAETI